MSTLEKVREFLSTEEPGAKHDQEKDRWELLPLRSLREVVKVLTFGAKKYGANNWQKVENPRDRYFAACMRHLIDWREALRTHEPPADPESGLSHLAHAICCLLFCLAFEVGDT